MKRLTWFLVFLTTPAWWNACGDVSFKTSSGSVTKSCGEAGADLANCLNPSSYRPQSQSIVVNAGSAVDILFVVDNSVSMQQEQVGIGNKIAGFLNSIQSLDWQIALTTTDENPLTMITGDTKRPWGDGQFRPFDSNTGSEFILRSGQVSAATAQTKLANAIQVGLAGGSRERGINATYQAISRSLMPSAQRDFFRPNAKLAVVLISDEDECSKGHMDCPVDVRGSSTPENLVAHVRSTLGVGKGFQFNSIIRTASDTTCTSAYVANTYKTMSDLTGGAIGSVCATDYTAILSNIGNQVVSLVNSATLACAPVDVNGDGKVDVQVSLAGGGVMTSGFTVNGVNVSFANPLPAGAHRFDYFCQ